MSKILKTLVTLVGITFSSISYTAMASYENNVSNAENFVKTISTRVETLLKQPLPSGVKEHNLDDIFNDVTDIDWVGKYVIGRYWQNLSESQKVTYLQNYRKFLISSYVPLFKDYNGQKVEIKGVKSLDDNQYLTTTIIYPKDSETAPYKVEYRIKFNAGNFKVRDIIAEGVSMLATQRSEFSAILNNNGYDTLNAKLIERANSTN